MPILARWPIRATRRDSSSSDVGTFPLCRHTYEGSSELLEAISKAPEKNERAAEM